MISKDRLRTDIAEALRMDSGEIADDDNLFDLGLDSMRVMDLLMRWEADGLRTDFSRFFEVATVADWWQVIEDGWPGAASA